MIMTDPGRMCLSLTTGSVCVSPFGGDSVRPCADHEEVAVWLCTEVLRSGPGARQERVGECQREHLRVRSLSRREKTAAIC